MSEELVALSLRIPKDMDARLKYLTRQHEIRTGFQLSKTELVRKLIIIGLEHHGVPRDVEHFKTNKTG